MKSQENGPSTHSSASSDSDNTFSISKPNAATLQRYKEDGLVVEFKNKTNPNSFFRNEWSASRITTWLKTLFPKQLTYIEQTYPDDQRTGWILLTTNGSSRRLVEFVKRGGGIDGDDLQTVLVGVGKAWNKTSLYFSK
jgi:hypothetical protein